MNLPNAPMGMGNTLFLQMVKTPGLTIIQLKTFPPLLNSTTIAVPLSVCKIGYTNPKSWRVVAFDAYVEKVPNQTHVVFVEI